MIVHKNTDNSEINFGKLEERILEVNNEENIYKLRRLEKYINLAEYYTYGKTILIIATGGSKAVAYYLKLILEKKRFLVDVIEPRTYFYMKNNDELFDNPLFKHLIVISSSGKTNGIEEILNDFNGDKYLITSNNFTFESSKVNKKYSEGDLDNFIQLNYVVPDKERSFISLATSFEIMACLLSSDLPDVRFEAAEAAIKVNDKIKDYINRSKKIIDNFTFDFSKSNMIEIISGYDTIVSQTILESNLVESGSACVTIHDKGSYCHGRSNLLFQNPNNPIIYLSHNNTELDETILEVLKNEYPNVFVFNTFDENVSVLKTFDESIVSLRIFNEKENLLFKEYYLSLQMAYLSRKIAFDRKIDLTQPEYNPKVIKKLYDFKGRM